MMHWIKQRTLEYEDLIAPNLRGIVRLYCRLRSDGSMWYQGDIPIKHSDPGIPPLRVERRFEDFLGRVVPRGAHSGWTEQDFDEDFLERLQRMNGKEITLVAK